MIYKALELLRQNLEDYIQLNIPEDEEENVALDNISLFEKLRESEDTPKPNVIMSLVNLEEEAALKNNSFYRTIKSDQTVDYHSAPLFLNLHVLITANHEDYVEALKKLSMVVQYFQGKKYFTISNSYDPDRPIGSGEDLVFDDEEQSEFKMNVELYSMSFEQVNHLWGSLGGRQVPFALYIMRLVRVEDKVKERQGTPIRELLINPNK